jgi:DeoR family fructose operon transcriptional repressor
VPISSNLATEERMTWIRQELDKAGQVRISEAAEQLAVSEMTVRRDLQELEAAGLARRIRGGAVAIGPVAFSERHRQRARAKSIIAAKLLPMIPPTGAAALDASSTILRLATAIPSARDLTIVTNGPEAFQALQDKPGVTPVLTGGTLEARTGSLVGPIACRSAGQILVHRFFMSAAAAHAEIGTSEACLDEAEVKRAQAAVAAEVVLAVDASKLDQRSVALSLEWDEIDVLVTEMPPDHESLRPFRKLARIV